MSKAGRTAAREFGENLPRYNSLAEAHLGLLAERDRLLALLRGVAANSHTFSFDFSPESLKALEGWYFDLLEGPKFEKIGLDRETFERCIAMYLGAVVVRNCAEFDWLVRQFPFVPGRYEIGVARPLYARMLTCGIDLARRPNNSRRQSLWRDYRQCAA